MADKATQFKQHLEQLHEVITRGLSFYAVWKKLLMHDENEVPWSRDRQNQVLTRWNGFFTPVGLGLQSIAMLEFAKILDADSDTVSLTSLINEAKNDSALIPNALPNELKDISYRLRQAKTTRETIRKLRNQRLAHADRAPDALPPLMNQEVESLIEDIKFAFNRLSVAHDNNYYSWDQALRGSERDTSDILRILVDEINRKEKEYDDTIVEIASGAIKDAETALGRSLDDQELESVLRQYSPTPKQAELIRRAHDA